MFKKDFRYFNRWFVVGQITNIQNLQRTQGERAGESYGAQLTVNTGSPSGIVRVRIINNRNVPNAYQDLALQFEEGSRVAVGLSNPQWLRLSERYGNNGRVFRDFTMFHLPELATLEQHDRVTGKLTGELIEKRVVDNHLEIVVEYFDTDRDGNEILRNGESNPQHFTFVARDEVAQRLNDVPIGANIEVSARFYNELVRDDFGDIVSSFNEVRVEKFTVHGQAVANATTSQPTANNPFGQPTPQSVTSPFGNVAPQPQPPQFPGWPPATADVPFPGVGQ
jgi:hypothetical protein